MNKQNIEIGRHSLAHVLAMAVLELYPEAKLGMGPAIEHGFYYDFDLSHKFSPADLPKIEKKMKEIIKKDISFQQKKVQKKEATSLFKNQPYKLEILQEIPEDEISLYQSGDFIDLCRGPHLSSTKEINPKAFKLQRVAGAYWKGDENKPMLQRIYGLAFSEPEELENYLHQLEEAEKRDHRKLGKQLDLFHVDSKIGPGLILWHPAGAILKRIVENYVLDEYLKNGYQLVNTPHIAKINLWETSGHTNFYQENMFPPLHLAEISQDEKEDYQLKPMNCPFHILIYQDQAKSYRDLPLRYTELGTVYRYEKSGTLHGLTRVRGFTQDDAHIWCRADQLEEELKQVLSFALNILKTFGFKEYDIYLSTRPEKYIGDNKSWELATSALENALKKVKSDYLIDQEGGVFYGPKIDIKIKDAIGRSWQCSTIQVDFNLPEKFDQSFINTRGEKERPIMIHRALLGSIERFLGVLLENYAGDLPLWLAPIQLMILPISEKYQKEAKKIADQFSTQGFRVQLDDREETVSKRIRDGELKKIPYLVVIGEKEIKNNSLSVRQRGRKELFETTFDQLKEKIITSIEKKE
jgi:threonyl-tRNA synthetase